MRKLVFCFVLSIFSSYSYSADYSWYINGKSQLGEFSSPTSACNADVASRPGPTTYTFEGLTRVNDGQFICNLKYRTQAGTTGSETPTAIRLGTQCPPDTTFNPATGNCDSPPPDECEEKAGQTAPYSKSGDIDDGYYSVASVGGKKYGVTPNDGCMGGCAVAVQANCISSISTNSYSCKGKAYYSGASCTASTETPQVEQEENYTPDEPKNTEIKEPCVYTTDAEGRSVCVSKASLEKEGQNCGSYNGQTLCVPKQATKDETTVETEVTETADPDGGKTTVKKDVATVTKCTGSNKSCTTTTTTTTTTTKADGSGTTTKTDVVCKGANCGSGVGGVGSGDGSGSGDGEGEEGEEGGELEGQDEVAGFGESLQDFNTRIASAPILSTVTSIAMPRGGSCSMPSASIPVIGSVSFNWICDNANLLDPLYYVMLAIWALFAIRVFLEA